MLNSNSNIAVSSRSFCRSVELRTRLDNVFNDVKYNDQLEHFNEESLIKFFSDAEAVIVSEDKISKNVIDALPNLRILAKFGVGLDSIDVEYLKEKNIILGWNPGINAEAVAQLSLSYIILMLREAYPLNRKLINNEWAKIKESRDMSGLTIGIVGYGNVGKKLASYLKIFDTDVIAYDPFLQQDRALSEGVKLVSFDEILNYSDALSLHVPLNEDTKNLFGKKEINKMKKGSVLVNLSRGGVVQETALLEALESGHLSGAASDVFEHEPENTNIFHSTLLNNPNFFSTPHIAGTTNQTIQTLGENAIKSLTDHYQR
tara:strand:- start:1201 stop:2151 length:951 start_codon:yes stop_codon:yes gene_type:complete